MGLKLKPASSIVSAIPAPLQVVIAIISIQFGASLAVGLFSSLSPGATVFFRVAISAMLLFVLIRPKLSSDVFNHFGLLLSYGITLGLMNWCFYEAIARIPLGIAVTIEFMGPLLVAAVSSKTRLDIFWIAIAFAGLLMLTPKIGDDLDTIGVVFAILAGIGWGGFVLLSKRVNQCLNGNDGLVYGMIIATLFLSVFAMGEVSVVVTNTNLLTSLLVLAVLSTTVPFFLEFNALKTLSAQTYGVLITLEPAAAAIIGMLVLGDVLGLAGMIAIILVTIAAIGATLTRPEE
jgi:inner membrane transporter RhtA